MELYFQTIQMQMEKHIAIVMVLRLMVHCAQIACVNIMVHVLWNQRHRLKVIANMDANVQENGLVIYVNSAIQLMMILKMKHAIQHVFQIACQ